MSKVVEKEAPRNILRVIIKCVHILTVFTGPLPANNFLAGRNVSQAQSQVNRFVI